MLEFVRAVESALRSMAEGDCVRKFERHLLDVTCCAGVRGICWEAVAAFVSCPSFAASSLKRTVPFPAGRSMCFYSSSLTNIVTSSDT